MTHLQPLNLSTPTHYHTNTKPVTDKDLWSRHQYDPYMITPIALTEPLVRHCISAFYIKVPPPNNVQYQYV